jgi:hypothetical protein
MPTPTELATHIASVPELLALVLSRSTDGAVAWYASPHDTPRAVPVATREIASALIRTGSLAQVYVAAASLATTAGATTLRGSAALVIDAVKSGLTIDRDDQSFRDSVEALVAGGVITGAARDALRALFVKSITRAENVFGLGTVITDTDIHGARTEVPGWQP